MGEWSPESEIHEAKFFCQFAGADFENWCHRVNKRPIRYKSPIENESGIV